MDLTQGEREAIRDRRSVGWRNGLARGDAGRLSFCPAGRAVGLFLGRGRRIEYRFDVCEPSAVFFDSLELESGLELLAALSLQSSDDAGSSVFQKFLHGLFTELLTECGPVHIQSAVFVMAFCEFVSDGHLLSA